MLFYRAVYGSPSILSTNRLFVASLVINVSRSLFFDATDMGI
jgi:hypothetical protein